MFFLPYKLDVSLYRVPILTLLVCLICVLTFMQQQYSDGLFEDRVRGYCAQTFEPYLAAILREAGDSSDTTTACVTVFLGLRRHASADQQLLELAHKVRRITFYPDAAQNREYVSGKLAQGYHDFEAQVPRQLTEALQYNPQQFDLRRMISSTFAHGSWSHLLGNLFFYFIFAASVEALLGSLHFTLAFVAMAVVTSVAFSLSELAATGLPTIGLSGVAMGTMALLTTLLPKARIWCFFWFFFFFRRFTIPVLLVAVWYVGWDLHNLMSSDGTSLVNYVAHVSGAATGVALGLIYRAFRHKRLQEAVLAVA